jgi:hypothetical protein
LLQEISFLNKVSYVKNSYALGIATMFSV